MELDFRTDPQILATIVDAMAVGVFTVDADGNFVAWSEGAERITGFTAQEIEGRPARILEGPRCKGFGLLTEMLRSADPPIGLTSHDCRLLAKDGRELHIVVKLRILKQRECVAGAVGAFSDMTEFFLANEKIKVLEHPRPSPDVFEQMVGASQAMKEVFRRLKLAAQSDVTTLVTGESGTGKELAAAAIHGNSVRHDKPFVAINCAAIPEPLLESELFGHVKGAFTGAIRDKVGVFEAAHGGTLLLDEIGEISPVVQVKMLRVLQQREVQRVGETQTKKVDVRLITATNQNLRSLIADGRLREDFYYRIRVYEVHLPALRERRDDIPLLVRHFMAELNRAKGMSVDSIGRDAMQLVVDYRWPGNVRELRNCIEHAFVTVSENRIGYLDLPAEIRDPHNLNVPSIQDEFSAQELEERERIIAALRETGGNRTQAAALLGTSRVTLWKKIGRYAIAIPPRGER